jgi:YD repeat-containing protein
LSNATIAGDYREFMTGHGGARRARTRARLADRPAAPGTDEDVTTTYDGDGNVASVTNGTVHSTFIYDTAHRLTSRTDVINGRTFV